MLSATAAAETATKTRMRKAEASEPRMEEARVTKAEASEACRLWVGLGRRAGPNRKAPRTAPHVGLGSFPAVPAGQRRGRSTSISGPPPRVTRRPDDNALDLLS
jgi:hypothetical protein